MSPVLRRWRRSMFALLALGGTLLSVRLALPALAPSPDVRLDALQADWAQGLPGERVVAMRSLNPEYDFMSRTFLVLALADRAIAEPTLAHDHLRTIDAIIDDTLEAEARHGQDHWLMSYWQPDATVGTGRSLFVDGEVLVMVTARRMVRDDRPELKDETTRRARLVTHNLGSGGDLPFAESYADEGWLFCHAMAMLGLRAQEQLDGVDHSVLFTDFERAVRSTLIDPHTGMLASEFTMEGATMDGPEGSSIWFVVSALDVVAPELAEEQYGLARQALGRSVLGLGYSREWPTGAEAFQDVDSGPIIPILDASTSASGFAIAAARVHDDHRFSAQLSDALGAAEAILQLSPQLAEIAGNPVADAVIVWGQGVGPLFDRLREAPPSRGT